MENVFILVGKVAYEGDDILGVYTTVEKAETAMKDYVNEGDYIEYDRFSIIEHEINQPALGVAEEEDDKERRYNSYDPFMLIK